MISVLHNSTLHFFFLRKIISTINLIHSILKRENRNEGTGKKQYIIFAEESIAILNTSVLQTEENSYIEEWGQNHSKMPDIYFKYNVNIILKGAVDFKFLEDKIQGQIFYESEQQLKIILHPHVRTSTTLKMKKKTQTNKKQQKNKQKKLARRSKQKGATSESIPREYTIKTCWVSDKGTDIITCLRKTRTVLKGNNNPQMTSTQPCQKSSCSGI